MLCLYRLIHKRKCINIIFNKNYINEKEKYFCIKEPPNIIKFSKFNCWCNYYCNYNLYDKCMLKN